MSYENGITSFVLIGVLAGLVAILDYVGVVSFPVGILGVSAFYIGAAFFTAFAIWFRFKGLLAIYIGLLIGALMAGTFTVFAFILALGNVIGASIPMFFFNSGKFDMSLKSPKDYLAFIFSVVVLQNLVAATWTLGGFVLFGIMPKEALFVAATGWIIGDILVALIIGIPLLKFTSPVIERTALFKKRKA